MSSSAQVLSQSAVSEKTSPAAPKASTLKALAAKKAALKHGEARRILEDRIEANRLSREIQDFQFDF